MSKIKVIAMYLPQFHCIPENDEFWGKGFTDWVTVKNAKPLFDGHQQPKVPLNGNYYDLSKEENVLWQAKLASEHGIYGFGVYHYWFNNEKNLLTKPAEIMRDAEDLGVKYFFAWDNGNWVRSWGNVPGNDWAPMMDKKIQQKNKGVKILIPYILGREEDWENHYNYVKTHFLSPNYEKIDNKPIFVILNYSKEIGEMCKYWDFLSKKDGYNGMFFIFKHSKSKELPSEVVRYNYEPHHSSFENASLLTRAKKKFLRKIGFKDVTLYNYDKVWGKLLSFASNHTEKNLIHGAFVNYDDSPRRGYNKAKVLRGATPQKFAENLKKLLEISEKQGKQYLFLTAWNEWGEGAYLEPDKEYGNAYLEAVNQSVK